MMEISTAERIREHLKASGPQTTKQLMDALGMKFAQVWGHCRPQVDRGCLAFDPVAGYSYVRDARPITTKRVDPQVRIEAERERSRRRSAQRKADRAARGPVVRVGRRREVVQRDHEQRRKVESAQVMRNREIGISALVVPQPQRVESVAEFLSRGGHIQRLSNGDVSKASRFERLHPIGGK